MSTVRDSIEVAVSARVAYEGLSHFENYPQFMSGVMNVTPLSETTRLEQITDSTTRVIAELQVDAKQLMPSERHANEVLNRRLKADLDGFKRFLENRPTMPMNEASPATIARNATLGRNE